MLLLQIRPPRVSEILHQLKVRRRGGGRSAAGPSVYLTGTSEGTQVRGTPPKTPPPRVRLERAPSRFAIYTTLLQTQYEPRLTCILT